MNARATGLRYTALCLAGLKQDKHTFASHAHEHLCQCADQC